jgi:radical SAM superfamily enzyme YgiQ (UPF0313 family)
MMIQENISAPTTLLDFPTREGFARELKEHDYDVVGISSIIMNAGKVREMCRMVRELSPRSTIIVGGHVTSIPGLDHIIDADHIVRGEGIAWMRRYLGEDPESPLVHPPIVSGFGHRVMGIKVLKNMQVKTATIIPSVGCPMGCNFCTTSAFFGGKVVNFFESGEEMYRVMADTGAALGVDSFFVMDENFLLYKKRAMDLLERMKAGRKSWELYVFSSANAIRKYTMEELVELGISWVWMGLESPQSTYSKLDGTDTLKLTQEMRRHGIKVLGSSIVGLEHHTPQNIRDEIEYAVSHETDFHQFMLYTPLPGTPLHEQMLAEGRMLDVDLADVHGQYKFNWRHPFISRDDSQRFLDGAFWRDFERNGPSLYRICRTTLEGWKRYRAYPDLRVRERFEREARSLRTVYSGLLWAMERHMQATNENVSKRVRALRAEIRRECGALSSRVSGWLIGPWLYWAARREERRLAGGVTYEPDTIIDRRRWAGAA